MPFYEFRCNECAVNLDIYFGFTDKQESTCPHCEKPMVKVLQATPAVFRGGGWGGQ